MLDDVVWRSRFQRFGMIHVNVLIGRGVQPEDTELFFGPVHPHDQWLWLPNASSMKLEALAAKLGIYESGADAKGGKLSGRIAEGFSEFRRIRKMHCIWILKILTGEEDGSLSEAFA